MNFNEVPLCSMLCKMHHLSRRHAKLGEIEPKANVAKRRGGMGNAVALRLGFSKNREFH